MPLEPAVALARLTEAFREKARVIVAFSGGVDSAVLAKVGTLTLGDDSLAVIVDSESYAREEKDAAEAFARAMAIPHEVVWHSELADARYVANPVNRCYFCRDGLGDVLNAMAAKRGFHAVAVGSNVSDNAEWRPGMQAIRERGMWQPYLELGMDKEDVRALAKHLELPVWDKPSMACLSSRVPYGEPITIATLTRIGHAERMLRARGFRQVRVRTIGGDLARIEVERHEIPRLEAMRDDVARELAMLGYARVEVDARGYRAGALSEGLAHGA